MATKFEIYLFKKRFGFITLINNCVFIAHSRLNLNIAWERCNGWGRIFRSLFLPLLGGFVSID
jgi:hypothetical protein